MMRPKPILQIFAGLIGGWYGLLFIASLIQSERPRTYGEDLMGTGVLFLIPIAIILLQVPSAILGLIAAAIYQFSSKKKVSSYVRFGFCVAAFCVLSVPLLILLSMYVIADM